MYAQAIDDAGAPLAKCGGVTYCTKIKMQRPVEQVPIDVRYIQVIREFIL